MNWNKINNYQAVVLDTGILIEFMSQSQLSIHIDDYIISNPKIEQIWISDLTITEIYYIYARLHSLPEADELIEDLLTYVEVCPAYYLRLLAGKIKSSRLISLADCYAIALAEFYDIPVIFISERELREESEKNSFDQHILLIDRDLN